MCVCLSVTDLAGATGTLLAELRHLQIALDVGTILTCRILAKNV